MRVSSYFLKCSFSVTFAEHFLISLPHLAFSGSVGSFLKPRGPMLSQRRSAETSGCLFAAQGLCPPGYRLCSSLGWSFLQSPPEPLLWQIPFGLTGPRGGAVGATWQGPPISHIRSNLQSAVGGSLSPAPQRAAPVPPIVCGDREPFSSWPALEWRDVKS